MPRDLAERERDRRERVQQVVRDALRDGDAFVKLDVLRDRLAAEYGLPVEFDASEFQLARWISAADRKKLDEFVEANRSGIAEDLDGDLVYLARSQFYLDYTRERAPGIVFTDVKDVKAARRD